MIRFNLQRPVSYTYRGHATAPIPFPRSGPAPIRVTYEPANDGTHGVVRARFENDLEEAFPNARVVFVLQHGIYRVTGGAMEYTVDSDDGRFTAVAVRFDVPARGNGDIIVQR